jgi:hypothetical protein
MILLVDVLSWTNKIGPYFLQKTCFLKTKFLFLIMALPMHLEYNVSKANSYNGFLNKIMISSEVTLGFMI